MTLRGRGFRGYQVLHALINLSSHRTSPSPPSPLTLKSGTKACLLLPRSILFSSGCGIQSANRLKTSQTMGTPARTWRSLMRSFISSCRTRHPSPRIVAFTRLSPHLHTVTPLPMFSPTLGAVHGGGRQSKAAAAVENSWFEKVKSAVGRHSSQALHNVLFVE